MSRSLSRLTAALLAASLAACGGGGGAEGPAEPGPALVVREVILVGDGGDTLYTHGDHWHGFPVVAAGARARYALHFAATSRSADDHDLPPRADWFTLAGHPAATVAATVEQPATAAWEGDRLAGALVGRQAGASRVSLVLRRGTTTVKEAPALPFTVR